MKISENIVSLPEKFDLQKLGEVLPCEYFSYRRVQGRQANISSVYPEIELSFLRKRLRSGLPRFAVFPVFENRSMLWKTSSYKDFDGVDPRLPVTIRTSYEASFPWGSSWLDVQHSTAFRGFVPAETKKKIKKARSLFSKKELWIIAERAEKDWKALPESGDPLVIGHLVKSGRSFLVDKFDTTPEEEYVVREFTT